MTNLFRFEELRAKVQAAGDGRHEIPDEDLNPTGLRPGTPYRREIGRTRTQYRPNDLAQRPAIAQCCCPSERSNRGACWQRLQAGLHAGPHRAGLPPRRHSSLACARRRAGHAARTAAVMSILKAMATGGFLPDGFTTIRIRAMLQQELAVRGGTFTHHAVSSIRSAMPLRSTMTLTICWSCGPGTQWATLPPPPTTTACSSRPL